MATKSSQEMLDDALKIGTDADPIDLLTAIGGKAPTQRQLNAIETRLQRRLKAAVKAFDDVDHDERAVQAFAHHFKAELAPRATVEALVKAVEAAQKETAAAVKREAALQTKLNAAAPFKARATTAERSLNTLQVDIEVITAFVEGEYGANLATLMLEAYEELAADEIEASARAADLTDRVNDVTRMMIAAQRGKTS